MDPDTPRTTFENEPEMTTASIPTEPVETQRQTAVYLVSGSTLDRQAYRLLLQRELQLAVVAESGFAAVEVWAAMRAEPDLAMVIADRASPQVHDALHVVSHMSGRTRTLIVSGSVDGAAARWNRAAVHGIVAKQDGTGALRQAIAAVLEGKTYFSPGMAATPHRSSHGSAPLSLRETELLPLLATGLTLRDAAAKMAISYKTADSYRTSLLRKLGLHDRVALARYAIREGIIDP